jgi:hypothetical protein
VDAVNRLGERVLDRRVAHTLLRAIDLHRLADANRLVQRAQNRLEVGRTEMIEQRRVRRLDQLFALRLLVERVVLEVAPDVDAYPIAQQEHLPRMERLDFAPGR